MLTNNVTHCLFGKSKFDASSIRVIFDKKLYRELLFEKKIAILDTNFKPKKAKNSLELTKFKQNTERVYTTVFVDSKT